MYVYVSNKQFKLKIHAEFENAASSNRKAPLKPHSTHEFTAKISAKKLKKQKSYARLKIRCLVCNFYAMVYCKQSN